jgi:hypothetical protein
MTYLLHRHIVTHAILVYIGPHFRQNHANHQNNNYIKEQNNVQKHRNTIWN